LKWFKYDDGRRFTLLLIPGGAMAQKLKEALAGPAKDKKEPAVADGILSITPDPPEAAEWRKSVLDTIAADSSFPADDEAGTYCIL
jgi:hypothetical protein